MTRYQRRGAAYISYLVLLLPVIGALLLTAAQLGRSAIQASAGHGANVARRQMILDVIRRFGQDAAAADTARIDREGETLKLTLAASEGGVAYRIGDGTLTRTETRGGAETSSYERGLGDTTVELQIEEVERAGRTTQILWMTFTFPVAHEIGPTPTRGMIAAETVGWRRQPS